MTTYFSFALTERPPFFFIYSVTERPLLWGSCPYIPVTSMCECPRKTQAAFRTSSTTHDYYSCRSRKRENSRCFQNITTYDHYSRRSNKRKTHATFRTSQLHTITTCISRKQKTHAAFRTSQLLTIIIHVDLENGKLALLSEHHNHTRSEYM